TCRLNRCGAQLLPQLNLHPVAIEDPGEATVILVLPSKDLDPLSQEVFHNSVDIVDTQVDQKRRARGLEIIGCVAERPDETEWVAVRLSLPAEHDAIFAAQSENFSI